MRTVIDLVGRLIQLVPGGGKVELNGGCRSVSVEAHIKIVGPIIGDLLVRVGPSVSQSVLTVWK